MVESNPHRFRVVIPAEHPLVLGAVREADEIAELGVAVRFGLLPGATPVVCIKANKKGGFGNMFTAHYYTRTSRRHSRVLLFISQRHVVEVAEPATDVPGRVYAVALDVRWRGRYGF